MKFERRTPCGNCPFRREAPLAYWHPDEYRRLRDMKRREGEFGATNIFGCHKDRSAPPEEQQPCVGWLLYQRERGVPSIALRVLLFHPDALAQFQESVPDGDLYDSIEELVNDNLEADRELYPERYVRKRRRRR